MMSKTVPELLIGVLEQVGVVKRSGNKDRTSTDTTMSARMGVGSWIILIVLLSLLVGTGVVIYFGWILGNGTDVPTSGYAAMAFGVIISLAVGFGLMALLFYSSRKGYDEPPVLIAPARNQETLPRQSNVGKPTPWVIRLIASVANQRTAITLIQLQTLQA
jgi:hypothetical protein